MYLQVILLFNVLKQSWNYQSKVRSVRRCFIVYQHVPQRKNGIMDRVNHKWSFELAQVKKCHASPDAHNEVQHPFVENLTSGLRVFSSRDGSSFEIWILSVELAVEIILVFFFLFFFSSALKIWPDNSNRPNFPVSTIDKLLRCYTKIINRWLSRTYLIWSREIRKMFSGLFNLRHLLCLTPSSPIRCFIPLPKGY